MNKVEDVVTVLNQFLHADVLDYELLERSVSQLAELSEPVKEANEPLEEENGHGIHPGIVLMDFYMHSEEKKEEARLLKLEYIKQQQFERAANMRDMEKDCETYMKFSKYYGLETSAFVLLQGFVIYTHFGDACNDEALRAFFEERKCLRSTKIGYDMPCYEEESAGC